MDVNTLWLGNRIFEIRDIENGDGLEMALKAILYPSHTVLISHNRIPYPGVRKVACESRRCSIQSGFRPISNSKYEKRYQMGNVQMCTITNFCTPFYIHPYNVQEAKFGPHDIVRAAEVALRNRTFK